MMKERESINQRIADVREDREHGSRWLVRNAIMIIRDLATFDLASQDEHMRQLYTAARELASARPAMAALASAMGQLLAMADNPTIVHQRATRLLEEYDAAVEHIARHARPYLSGQLMTCSLSGTVLEVLVACKQHITQVIVLEGRPRFEGRETARLLQQQGLAVTLITDAQADIFLPLCTSVVVGADSVLANGDVLNKAGTALLAWAAQGHHLPFNVLCETLKISAHRWSDDAAHVYDNLALLEEKEAQEVLDPPLPGVTVRNFYFDHTPDMLVSRWITERGLLERHHIKEIAAQVARNGQHLAQEYT
jgi:ribose 1,5-bisphosphate isomerase